MSMITDVIEQMTPEEIEIRAIRFTRLVNTFSTRSGRKITVICAPFCGIVECLKRIQFPNQNCSNKEIRRSAQGDVDSE